MRKLYGFFAAAMLIACGCLFASHADARVCFATDPDCGSGGNFGNMDGLNDTDCACIAAGYNCPNTSAVKCAKLDWTIRDKIDWDLPSDKIGIIVGKTASFSSNVSLLPISTTSCNPSSLKYHCPYNSACTKCCDPDYNYASCSYPLQIAGKCGDKYKCVCDSNKYKYSYDGAGNSQKCENNSTPGGSSCVHQVANSSKNGVDVQTFYAECKCDRALYPYTPDICDENAEVGDSCLEIDSSGVTTKYFSACYCNPKIFKYSAAGCSPYVGDETRGKCSSGGTTYYKTCKTCDGYPAKNLDHVGYNNGEPADKDYEVCPYRQVGAEYKILACRDPGYRVSKDGDYDVDENGEKIKDKNGNYIKLKAGEKCIPMECEEAVKYFVGKQPNYGYFNGTSLVDENGVKVSRTMAVIAKDISLYSQTCSGGTTVNRRLCTKFCCKYKVKAREENDWGDGDQGVATKKKKCIKSCCRIDGSNPEDSDPKFVPGENGICEEGVTTVTPDIWASGTNGKCLLGSSRVCTEVEEITEYEQTEIVDNGDTELELDSSCVSKAYDMTYLSTPEVCLTPNDANADDVPFYCSEITQTSVSSASKGLGCTDASSYYSAAYLAKQLGNASDGAKALNVACKKVPTLTYTGTFPNASNSSGYIYLYGLNLKFSGASNMGTKTVTLYDTNLQVGSTLTTQNGVYMYRQGYVNDGNLKVSGTNGANNGTLNIRNYFKSKGYAYDINKIDVSTNLSTAVFFDGENSKKDFNVAQFWVNGLAGFNNFNVYAQSTYIGSWLNKSGVTFYNTDWYLYRRESYTAYYMWMNGMAYLGNPQNCLSGSWGWNNSKIIFSGDRTARAMVARDTQYNGEDNSRPAEHIGSVPYIGSSGYVTSHYCSGEGHRLLCTGNGHHHSGGDWSYDWYGNSTSNLDQSDKSSKQCTKCVYW